MKHLYVSPLQPFLPISKQQYTRMMLVTVWNFLICV